MRDVAVVIDLGGGNTYYEGTVGIDRPVLAIINLGERQQRSAARRPGIQGGAVLGVSMLVNRGGDNIYEAQDVAQGSALAGVGILVDYGAATTATAASAACKARPSAASASCSTAAARTTITPPCGPRASAARWASACWTTSPATTTIIAAACGAIPTPKRPATRAGAKASGRASARWPTAASA